MAKDWTGNFNSVKKMLAASNLCDHDREPNDYYATEPKAAELLLQIEGFDKDVTIWEPASGENHLADVFKNAGYNVRTSDLIKRTPTTEVMDFLRFRGGYDANIITNPPYKYADEFVRKALEAVPEGRKVCMFLKVQFLEGKARKKLFAEFPPCRVWASSSRLKCAINGGFDAIAGSAVAYAWFVWVKGYKGPTELKWFN